VFDGIKKDYKCAFISSAVTGGQGRDDKDAHQFAGPEKEDIFGGEG